MPGQGRLLHEALGRKSRGRDKLEIRTSKRLCKRGNTHSVVSQAPAVGAGEAVEQAGENRPEEAEELGAAPRRPEPQVRPEEPQGPRVDEGQPVEPGQDGLQLRAEALRRLALGHAAALPPSCPVRD